MKKNIKEALDRLLPAKAQSKKMWYRIKVILNKADKEN